MSIPQRSSSATGRASDDGAPLSPLLILQARAEARAILYAACEFDLEQAVAPLTRYTLARGIIDEIGAEGARAIIRTAFAGVAEL